MASFAPVRGTQAEIEATAITDGQFLVETDQNNQNKAYLDILDENDQPKRIKIGGGGHDMLPDPETSTPTKDDVIDAVKSKVNTPSDKHVASVYGVANWTNSKIVSYVVSDIPSNKNTIGTWQDNEDPTQWTTTDWWFLPDLYHITQNNDIEIKIDFDVAHSEPIALLGFQISDEETGTVDGQTVNGGKICIKFTSHKNTCGLALKLVYNHTETHLVPYATIGA